MQNGAIHNTSPIEHMIDRINVHSVFGNPSKEGDITIIPVAEMGFGFGYGGGYGQSPSDDGEESPDATDSGGGGSGGGGGGKAKPQGYIRITTDDVSFHPTGDDARIPLAGIFMIVWSVFWITFTIRTIALAFRRK